MSKNLMMRISDKTYAGPAYSEATHVYIIFYISIFPHHEQKPHDEDSDYIAI